MHRTNLLRNTLRLLTLFVLPVLVYGCGGGGAMSLSRISASSVPDDLLATKKRPSVENPIDSTLPAPSTPVVTSDTRSVRLDTYNNPWFRNDNGWDTNQMIAVIAKKQNVMVTETWPLSITSSVKAINPQTKLYAYYALSLKNFQDVDGAVPDGSVHQLTPLSRADIEKQDWWLRDGNGQIVQETDHSSFIDVGKPGFKEAYLKNLLTRMSGRGLDGIVFDYWTPGIYSSYINNFMKGRPLPAQYPTDQDWFTKAWQPFVEYVMTGVHQAGYRIIGNCAGEYNSANPNCNWQRMFVDGTVYEQFAVDWQSTGGAFLSGSVIQRRIDAFSADPLEAWTADMGILKTDPLYDQKQKVALAMYYIAIPMSQTNRSFGLMSSLKVVWESVWDINIGVPAEAYTKKSNSYFWSRKYTSGLVLLNYEATASVSCTLDKKYKNPEGNILSGTISVPPHTGMILASQ